HGDCGGGAAGHAERRGRYQTPCATQRPPAVEPPQRPCPEAAMSAGRPGHRRFNRISGQFAPRLVEMLKSPAYCVLSLSARRVLDRIEIEFRHHGGKENGRLPVTFNDFTRYGIDRHSVAPAIRELEALGFIEVTEHGRGGNAEWRQPNKF